MTTDLHSAVRTAVDEARRLAQRATPGPWEVSFRGVQTVEKRDVPGMIYHGEQVPVVSVMATLGYREGEMQNAAVTAATALLLIFTAASTTTTAVPWEIDYIFGAASAG